MDNSQLNTSGAVGLPSVGKVVGAAKIPAAGTPSMKAPSMTPKKKFKIPGLLAVGLLIVLIGGLAYGSVQISQRLSSQNAVAPNAPSSEPQAAESSGAWCNGSNCAGTNQLPYNTSSSKCADEGVQCSVSSGCPCGQAEDKSCIACRDGNYAAKGSSGCTDKTWTPAVTEQCFNVNFPQKSNCNRLRRAFGTKTDGVCAETYTAKDPNYSACRVGYLFTNPKILERPENGFIPFSKIYRLAADLLDVQITVINLTGSNNSPWFFQDYTGTDNSDGSTLTIKKDKILWKNNLDLSGIDTLFVGDYVFKDTEKGTAAGAAELTDDQLKAIMDAYDKGMNIIMAADHGIGASKTYANYTTRQILEKLKTRSESTTLNYTDTEVAVTAPKTPMITNIPSMPTIDKLEFFIGVSPATVKVGATNVPNPYYYDYRSPGVVNWTNENPNLICVPGAAIGPTCLLSYLDERAKGKGTILLDTNAGWAIRYGLSNGKFVKSDPGRICSGQIACLETALYLKDNATMKAKRVASGEITQAQANTENWYLFPFDGSKEVDRINQEAKLVTKAKLDSCSSDDPNSKPGVKFYVDGKEVAQVNSPAAGTLNTYEYAIGNLSSLATGIHKFEATAICKAKNVTLVQENLPVLVSQGKKIYSTSNWSTTFPAKNANDGLISTIWASDSYGWATTVRGIARADTDPVLVIDLGAEYCLNKVEVEARKETSGTTATIPLLRNNFKVVAYRTGRTKTDGTPDLNKVRSDALSSASGIIDLGKVDFQMLGYSTVSTSNVVSINSTNYTAAVNKAFPVRGMIAFPGSVAPSGDWVSKPNTVASCSDSAKARYVALVRTKNLRYKTNSRNVAITYSAAGYALGKDPCTDVAPAGFWLSPENQIMNNSIAGNLDILPSTPAVSRAGSKCLVPYSMGTMSFPEVRVYGYALTPSATTTPTITSTPTITATPTLTSTPTITLTVSPTATPTTSITVSPTTTITPTSTP